MCRQWAATRNKTSYHKDDNGDDDDNDPVEESSPLHMTESFNDELMAAAPVSREGHALEGVERRRPY